MEMSKMRGGKGRGGEEEAKGGVAEDRGKVREGTGCGTPFLKFLDVLPGVRYLSFN